MLVSILFLSALLASATGLDAMESKDKVGATSKAKPQAMWQMALVIEKVYDDKSQFVTEHLFGHIESKAECGKKRDAVFKQWQDNYGQSGMHHSQKRWYSHGLTTYYVEINCSYIDPKFEPKAPPSKSALGTKEQLRGMTSITSDECHVVCCDQWRSFTK